jgi:transposase
MSHSITLHKMYKYRLYRCDKKDGKLRHKLFVASTIWNHFIALQRRYYRLTGKYISLHDMNPHVLKLRKRPAFALWRDLHSQACQEVCRRVDDTYQRFFKGLAKGRPKFKKAKKYKSFTSPCGIERSPVICGLVIDRDHNAVINILCAGASALYQSEHKTGVRLRTRVDGSSSRL